MADFTIEFDDREVQAAFKRLIEFGDNLTPLFNDIGEYLLKEHEQRWENSTDSKGNLWEGLLLKTWTQKEKRKKPFMLVDSLDMLSSGVYQADKNSLSMGLTDYKAPFHHFGTEFMPARELLGINAQDEDEILNLVADHIKSSLK